MIAEVTFEKTTYADLPHKFEAGTPNIAGGIAFGAALDYLNSIGMEKIAEYEQDKYKKNKFDHYNQLIQKNDYLAHFYIYCIHNSFIYILKIEFCKFVRIE